MPDNNVDFLLESKLNMYVYRIDSVIKRKINMLLDRIDNVKLENCKNILFKISEYTLTLSTYGKGYTSADDELLLF